VKYPLYILMFLIHVDLRCQTYLRITYTHFGVTRIYNVPNYDVMEYKLKGESRFHKNKIFNMKDSSILFENYTEIKLNQLKALRIKKHNHLVSTFQNLFLLGGVGFVTLNTINNLITDTSPVFNEKAAYISAALLATSLLIREMNIKRIRITKNKALKILNIDFQHLGTDSTNTR